MSYLLTRLQWLLINCRLGLNTVAVDLMLTGWLSSVTCLTLTGSYRCSGQRIAPTPVVPVVVGPVFDPVITTAVVQVAHNQRRWLSLHAVAPALTIDSSGCRSWLSGCCSSGSSDCRSIDSGGCPRSINSGGCRCTQCRRSSSCSRLQYLSLAAPVSVAHSSSICRSRLRYLLLAPAPVSVARSASICRSRLQYLLLLWLRVASSRSTTVAVVSSSRL